MPTREAVPSGQPVAARQPAAGTTATGTGGVAGPGGAAVPPRPTGGRGAAGWARAAAYLAAGLVTGWCALYLREPPGVVRVCLALAAPALLYAAVRAGARAARGPSVRPGPWLALLWLGLLTAAAALADILPLADYHDPARTLAVPAYAGPDLFSAHPLGTDSFSLDVLARCVHGARVSLLTAVLAVSISVVVGGSLGILAGYFRRLDTPVGVLTDSFLAFPGILLLISVSTILGQPTTVTQAILKTGLGLAVVGTPIVVRLARAHTVRVAQRDHVFASRAMGSPHARIIRHDIAPMVAPPVLAYSFVLLALLIVAEGALSYVGLGLSQPEPTWGNMIAQGGLDELRSHPSLALVPGIFMFLTVFSLNTVGETLQRRHRQT
ncbi:ABC transporter permease [Frankia sp. Cpl3]|nr:ABC transporter permease [Frankia sp. Cpl3]